MNLIADIAEKLQHPPYKNDKGQILSGIPHGFPFQEDNQQTTLNSIEHTKWSPDQVHLGLGGFYNLDVVATGSPYAILFDVNADQPKFWNTMLSIIRSSQTRDDCIEQIRQQGSSFCRVNHKMKFAQEVTCESSRSGGWLSSEERYQKVRKAALENRIQPILLDIFDKKGCKKLKAYLTEKRLRVGILYLSNTPLLAIGEKGFYDEAIENNAIKTLSENIRELSTEETQIVASGLFNEPKGSIAYISYTPRLMRFWEVSTRLTQLKSENEVAFRG